MPRYVDGFVIPIPKKNVKAYSAMAKKASKVWMELGALEYRECVGEDMNVSFGVPFTKLTRTKPTETVVFSWIVYKSRAHRDAVNKKVMKDPRIAKMCDPADMPFDCKKMVYGGFQVLVEG
jgi:uncharacterized protein YbaA (DUF1428 family)